MKLQNNFTTPEQSKRLLELGVPADSADMRYTRIKGNQDWHRPYIITTGCKFHGARCMEALPCWSVGRLIEIELLCREQKEGMTARLFFYQTDKQPIDGIGTGNIVEGLVRYLECKDYKYDFSKLED